MLRHSGTRGQVYMGGISKRGDANVRNLLNTEPGWVSQMLLRRPMNMIVVVPAHKMARMAWALLAHGRHDDARWQLNPPDMTRAAAMDKTT